MLGPTGTDDLKVKYSKHNTEGYDDRQLFISLIKIQVLFKLSWLENIQWVTESRGAAFKRTLEIIWPNISFRGNRGPERIDLRWYS